VPPVRVSVDNYISPEFARGEAERLWPKVWQVACREEELAKVGDFVTYNIVNESIVVLRNKDGLAAFHNVCPHRGRRLAEGCGKANVLRCSYHGWTFGLDGRNVQVLDRDDWDGSLDGEDLDLVPVRLDTWGGFVFINLDPDCESLSQYLEQIPDYLDPFEYDKLRYRWKVELHLPVNWKTALEAFVEAYHVSASHPQMLPIFGNDYTQSYALGKHSHFGYWKDVQPLGTPSPRLKTAAPADPRPGVIEFFRQMEEDLMAIFTDRDYEAAKKIMDILPAEVDAMTAFGTAVELGRQAAVEDGAGYPENLDFEKVMRAGADFTVFPNCATLFWFDGALWYRARPDPRDPYNPDKCIFDVWSLKRFAPGKEPQVETRVIEDGAKGGVCLILDQDIANMTEVQAGMKSSAFRYGRPNPVQEVPVINLHRTIEQYVLGQARG